MPDYKARVCLEATGRRRRYARSEHVAIEIFRASQLNEATLRPVKESDFEPCTLRRTSAGAVVILREVRV